MVPSSNRHGGSGGGEYYGGGDGSSCVMPEASAIVYLDGAGQAEGNYTLSNAAGRGGNRCQNGPGGSACSRSGNDGYVSVSWTE